MSSFLTDGTTILAIYDDIRDSMAIWGRQILSTAPADDDLYTWDAATSKWVPTSANELIAATDLNHIQLDIAPTAPDYAEGQLYWDADDHTLLVRTEVEAVTLQVGQEQHVRATNKTGVQIDDGAVVYVSGAIGDRPTIALASASTPAHAMSLIGIATQDIADNGTGYVTTFGLVRNLDTSAYVAGDTLYLSTVAGDFTDTMPTSPDQNVRLGTVLTAHASVGVLLFNHARAPDLEELSDVLITGVSGQDVVFWDATNSRWANSGFSTMGFGGVFNVQNGLYGSTGDGSTDDYAAIVLADTAAAIVGGTVFFPFGAYKYETNLTFSTNVTVWLEAGATLKPDSGIITTITGPFLGRITQAFDVSLGGEIRFDGDNHEVYPEWWGIDGTADQVEINAAIDSLAEYDISDPGDHQRMSWWQLKGVVNLLGTYDITAPILFETSTDEDNISRNGIVLDGAGTGVITINSAFAGVSRSYDKIGGSQVLKAAIVMGAKNYGLEGGQTQMWNKVRGLEIQGIFSGGTVDVSVMGIWSEFCTWCEITDMRFYALGYGLKARIINGSTLTNWICQRVPSALTIYNDTPDIKDGDATSEWGTNGDEANGNTIDGIRFNASPMTVYTDNADLEDMVGFDFYQSGENNVSNLIGFSGSHALRVHNGAFVRAQRWNRFNNMEFAGQEGWAVKFDDKRLQIVDNLQVVYAVRDTIASAHFDYTDPYVIMNDCQGCEFGKLVVDRDTDRAGQKGGHSLAITGTSVGNTFGSVSSYGSDAVEADATYSHISIEDNSIKNKFGNLQLGGSPSSAKNMLHGISLGNSCLDNHFSSVQIDNQTDTPIDWGSGSGNTMEASVSVGFATDGDATPSVWNLKSLKFNNDPSIDVTMLDDGFPFQTIVCTDLKAAGTPTTVKDGGNMKIAGDWVPSGVNDTLVLMFNGTNWVERGRSTN